jgi:hypothetical protein
VPSAAITPQRHSLGIESSRLCLRSIVAAGPRAKASLTATNRRAGPWRSPSSNRQKARLKGSWPGLRFPQFPEFECKCDAMRPKTRSRQSAAPGKVAGTLLAAIPPTLVEAFVGEEPYASLREKPERIDKP